MTWIIGLLLAGGIGLSLGLMGGGGSVLALPVYIRLLFVSSSRICAGTKSTWFAVFPFMSQNGHSSYCRRGKLRVCCKNLKSTTWIVV